MTAAALLFAMLCAAGTQDKTYELKLEAQPRKGDKLALNESYAMKMVMKAMGQVAAQRDEKRRVEGVEEVLSSDGAGNAEIRLILAKGERTSEGETEPYGFVGKPVLVKIAKGKETEFRYADGTPLAEEDADVLRSKYDRESDRPGRNPGKLLAPRKPVKVGESWSPDASELVKAFDQKMADGVDPKASSSKFTLVSVEKRGGSEFGKIQGSIVISMPSMGPMKLEKPVPITMSFDLDVCIDGTTQAGVMKMKVEMKGATAATVEGAPMPLQLDIDMTAANEATRTPVQ